ncbi:MAG: hydroxyacid dehydrogenase [Actinomyces sp.]|nr:MAG: hydroxyacid dehydrogenase [Actinomyces sp.]
MAPTVQGRRVAVEPRTRPVMRDAFVEAVRAGGGELAEPETAEALVWADPANVDAFPAVIARAPGVRWIQLPYAGIEPFVDHLDHEHVWTCGKGVYAAPVAEHVVALSLAGLRDLHRYARERTWSAQTGRNLLGARVTVIGAGGITSELVRLLEPWQVTVTVVRRLDVPFPGVDRVVTTDRLHEAVAGADVVVVACALTPETTGIIDRGVLEAMADHAWLVNVGRGAHVVTADLVAALDEGLIGGAALDVTDPEPLPDDSPLWGHPRCLITPHVGNTPEMGLPLIARRVRENVERFVAGEPLLGLVDVDAGY